MMRGHASDVGAHGAAAEYGTSRGLRSHVEFGDGLPIL